MGKNPISGLGSQPSSKPQGAKADSKTTRKEDKKAEKKAEAKDKFASSGISIKDTLKKDLEDLKGMIRENPGMDPKKTWETFKSFRSRVKSQIIVKYESGRMPKEEAKKLIREIRKLYREKELHKNGLVPPPKGPFYSDKQQERTERLHLNNLGSYFTKSGSSPIKTEAEAIKVLKELYGIADGATISLDSDQVKALRGEKGATASAFDASRNLKLNVKLPSGEQYEMRANLAEGYYEIPKNREKFADAVRLSLVMEKMGKENDQYITTNMIQLLNKRGFEFPESSSLKMTKEKGSKLINISIKSGTFNQRFSVDPLADAINFNNLIRTANEAKLGGGKLKFIGQSFGVSYVIAEEDGQAVAYVKNGSAKSSRAEIRGDSNSGMILQHDMKTAFPRYMRGVIRFSDLNNGSKEPRINFALVERRAGGGEAYTRGFPTFARLK